MSLTSGAPFRFPSQATLPVFPFFQTWFPTHVLGVFALTLFWPQAVCLSSPSLCNSSVQIINHLGSAPCSSLCILSLISSALLPLFYSASPPQKHILLQNSLPQVAFAAGSQLSSVCSALFNCCAPHNRFSVSFSNKPESKVLFVQCNCSSVAFSCLVKST